MTVCIECSLDFYALSSDICNKCRQLDGKTEVEKVSIQNKPQCQSCSAVYGQLQGALCAACVKTWSTSPAVPREILAIPGAMQQLVDPQSSDLTSAIWELAEQYQSTASETRLGQPTTRPINSNLQKTQSAITHNQRVASGASRGSTATNRVQQLQVRRDMAHRIQLSGRLAIRKGNNKIVPVLRGLESSVFSVHIAAEHDSIDAAINELVFKIQEAYRETNAIATITRQDLSVGIIQSATMVHNLTTSTIARLGTVQNLLAHCVEQNIIEAKAANDKKTVPLRFVVGEDTLTIYSNNNSSRAAASLRPKVLSHRISSLPASAHQLERVMSVPSDLNKMRISALVQPTNVRASGWRPRSWGGPAASTFQRDPPLAEVTFQKYNIKFDDGKLTMSLPVPAIWRSMQITVKDDWQRGRALENKGDMQSCRERYKTGFIGEGWIKTVIYVRLYFVIQRWSAQMPQARIGTDEYALAQAQDDRMTESSHLNMLVRELENMYLGEEMRTEFVKLGAELKVQMPGE
ncbi:hypothetical protein GGX14DRAFT_397528 [Mycena pura]|uniref:Uncharacterized protein n=1 Tax=Mycena pura TaxID=153505 RepID=A0AAD6V8A8_9AGAR|nr:hypothetical protein GGX14DRAFT_397528 [Mycena pura]